MRGGYYSPAVFRAGHGDTTSEEKDPRRPAAPGERSAGRLKLFATVTGLLGALLALAVPFLPVQHDITTLRWPTAEGTTSVSAPLTSYSPQWLDATVPCSSARSLDARTPGPGVLLSTNPPNSDYGKITGLTLQVDNGQVALLSKGQQLNSVPIPERDCAITVHSDAFGTRASIGDQALASMAGDQRPQLTGIYSSLDESVDDVRGLSFEARVDNRYESYATTLKLVVIALAVVSFIGSVVALRRLDIRAGRRPPRLAPLGWWRPTAPDVTVFGALVMWWLIGAMTSDDGYILTIARAREDAGYISNYFRWFAVPEAPFGWFYELYSLWIKVSTVTPWVRLPALLMGVVCWLLISREVLPRLGQQVRRSQAACWAAAAVFLAFWLPYNNGLRPEPVVVLFSLLALCAVERALVTGRLMPAALGLVGAALAVGANPHGLVAVLPYLVALKPLVRLLRMRIREFGWLPVLAPIAACGFVILTVVFSDQTWQSVADATTVRTDLGPSEKWYQELNRYTMLFSDEPSGSLTRRFPVLLVILCLATCAVVLLRRGRIGGASLGASRRLLAVAALSFVVLALTPTKHTHHFGIFAAVGGALAALTALATSSTVLRSKRNRAAFFAGLMLICALAATGNNSWWYVSAWGVPWFDTPPSFDGRKLSTMLLIVAAIAGVVAFLEHMRLDERNATAGQSEPSPGMEKRSRALRLGTAPLSIICALIMVSELATFAKVIYDQWDGYSLGSDNIRQLTGASCGLSDYVYAETNPQAGMLRVSEKQPEVAAAPVDPAIPVPPDRLAEEEEPEDYLGATMEGFNRSGLPPGDGSAPQEPDWRPPHEFGSDTAPVWGSYDQAGLGTGEVRTQWYDLPKRVLEDHMPVVIALAGAESGANSVYLEFGRETDHGFEILERQYVHQSGSEWREYRAPVSGRATDATKVRVVATDQALGPNGWVAVGAPRAPHLTNMTDVVGDSPSFIEWPAALVHPCLQTSAIRNGVAEMPKFRIAAGDELRGTGQGWSSPDGGGPFGWLNVAASVRKLPTYMSDLHKDWGTLYAVDPYEPDALPAEAAMEVHTETHWGWWSPGPLTKTVRLPGDVPDSDDRDDITSFSAEHVRKDP